VTLSPVIHDPLRMQQETALLRRAFRKGWVDDETGRHIVQEMRRLVDNAPNIRDRIAAARVVLQAAAVDARREGHDVQAATADKVSARDTAARLLSTPEGRALCARQAELLDAPSPPEVALDDKNGEPVQEESDRRENANPGTVGFFRNGAGSAR
jgi:hypothetical protein